MSIYPVPYLISSLFFLSLGLFVLFKNRKSKINRAFSFWCFTTFVWQFSVFMQCLLTEKYINLVLLFIKIDYTGVILIPPAYFYFLITALEYNKEKKIAILYGLSSFIFIYFLWFTPLFISYEPYRYSWGYYAKVDVLHIFYLALIVIFATKSIILLLQYKRKIQHDYNKYNQFRYFFWALIIYIFSAIDFVQNYGLSIYPLGFIFTSINAMLITYAIFRHQLMDITIAIRRTLVYSTLVALITALFVVPIILFEKFLQGFTGYKSLFVSALAAFIIALGFNPVKNIIQRFLDRYFFKGTVEEIAQENIRLYKEVQESEKMKAIATLAAGMAHEIKNPLTAIKTYAAFMPKYWTDKEFIDKFNRVVPESVNRIDRIVKDLLAFSRPTPPEFKEVKISDIASHTLDYVSNDLVRNGINYSFDFKDNGAIIQADPNQLTQVFLNLFLNAVDAMPQGGMLNISSKIVNADSRQSNANIRELPISDHSREIRDNPRSIEIRINDTGCGISAENLSHIFDPFFTTKDTGTGLGLSIVQEIVSNHQGAIRAESEAGKGTTFILEFPLIDTAKTQNDL